MESQLGVARFLFLRVNNELHAWMHFSDSVSLGWYDKLLIQLSSCFRHVFSFEAYRFCFRREEACVLWDFSLYISFPSLPFFACFPQLCWSGKVLNVNTQKQHLGIRYTLISLLYDFFFFFFAFTQPVRNLKRLFYPVITSLYLQIILNSAEELVQFVMCL